MNGEEITAARRHFEYFIKTNQCYSGQISITVNKFRRILMIPMLQRIKELEKKANE